MRCTGLEERPRGLPGPPGAGERGDPVACVRARICHGSRPLHDARHRPEVTVPCCVGPAPRPHLGLWLPQLLLPAPLLKRRARQVQLCRQGGLVVHLGAVQLPPGFLHLRAHSTHSTMDPRPWLHTPSAKTDTSTRLPPAPNTHTRTPAAQTRASGQLKHMPAPGKVLPPPTHTHASTPAAPTRASGRAAAQGSGRAGAGRALTGSCRGMSPTRCRTRTCR